MELSIHGLNNHPVTAQHLIQNYKLYIRTVDAVDMSAQGGFALVGHPAKPQHSPVVGTYGIDEHDGAFVICLDKKGPVDNTGKTPTIGRFAILLINAGIMKMNILPIDKSMSWLAFGELNISLTDSGNCWILATYSDTGREPYIENDWFSKLPTCKSVYYQIASDLNELNKAKVIELKGMKPGAMPGITEAVHESLNSLPDNISRFVPRNYKLIGHVGGIALYQSRLDPYSQPKLLAEIVMELPPDELGYLDELITTLQDQEKRALGLQGLAKMAIERVQELKDKQSDVSWGPSPIYSVLKDRTDITVQIHNDALIVDWKDNTYIDEISKYTFPGFDNIAPDTVCKNCGHAFGNHHGSGFCIECGKCPGFKSKP